LLLEPPNWLNDQIIGFAFEFFAREDIGDEQRVAFIDPAVTQMIKLCPEPYEIQGLLESLDLPKKELILVAINDNESKETAGGTHWALLVWHRSVGGFYYYDSLPNQNESAARKTALSLSPSIGATVPINFSVVNVRRQYNNYDCGMQVLSIAHQVALNFIHSRRVDDFFFDAESVDVKQFRQKLRKIVVALAKESVNAPSHD